MSAASRADSAWLVGARSGIELAEAELEVLRLAVGDARAENIARTEVHRAMREAQGLAFEAAP